MTLLVAGLIALVQTDIKRVIAYSTMSQIGYMFVAAGIGAYSTRHVPPDDARVLQGAAVPGGRHDHPRLGGEQDIRQMGGLRGRMPYTYIAMFLIGALALAGIPPFSASSRRT